MSDFSERFWMKLGICTPSRLSVGRRYNRSRSFCLFSLLQNHPFLLRNDRLCDLTKRRSIYPGVLISLAWVVSSRVWIPDRKPRRPRGYRYGGRASIRVGHIVDMEYLGHVSSNLSDEQRLLCVALCVCLRCAAGTWPVGTIASLKSLGTWPRRAR